MSSPAAAAASTPTVPEELLFQGSVDVLVGGKDGVAQEWGRRYLCVWCNPPCFALFLSDMAAKRAPDFYVSLPPNSEWHEDVDFQGAPPGTSFRLEAQVRGCLARARRPFWSAIDYRGLCRVRGAQ
jgi:hypothetical protein